MQEKKRRKIVFSDEIKSSPSRCNRYERDRQRESKLVIDIKIIKSKMCACCVLRKKIFVEKLKSL